MADPEPLISTHPVSRRSAIIDQDGEALWLYLTIPGEMTPATDCWLANTGSSNAPRSMDELRASGSPPPAPASVVDEDAGELPAVLDAYQLDWSENGEAVQALSNHRVIAFVVANQKPGFHVALRVDCPWGHPFDTQLHRQLFR